MINEIEKSIKEVCTDTIVNDYLKKFKVAGGQLYECTKLIVFGTQYHVDQYCLLQGSTNNIPVFGKIAKLLCSQDSAYLICQQTSNTYCHETDLFMVQEKNDYQLIATDSLAAFHPLESYDVSDANLPSISLIHYVVEHLNDETSAVI